MNLGFALTRHCNLRCPHCIRDDVTDVRSLPPDLFRRILDQARHLFAEVTVSFTGGEPLIHPGFDQVVDALRRRGLSWCLVTNGWHLERALPVLEKWEPWKVHLSLSGATRQVHDRERGRGSWDRLLQGLALLTSRRIPTCLSLVVDRRTRGELRRAADLAEELGASGLQYILPQPVPASAARNSDLPPDDWMEVRREVEALGREPQRPTPLGLAYGAPFEGPEETCRTFRMERMYVDAQGRVAACCQLSQYGANETEVVADLTVDSLAEARRRYAKHLEEQWRATRPDGAYRDSGLEDFPCLRCAASCGKLDWLERFPESPWHKAADMGRAASGARGAAAACTSDRESSRRLPVLAQPAGAPASG